MKKSCAGVCVAVCLSLAMILPTTIVSANQAQAPGGLYTGNCASELESAFAKIGEPHNEALMVLPHPLFNTRADVVVRLAAARRVPAIYPFRNYTEDGGLMSLGIDLPDSFRRAAYFVDRILKGAKPGELPIEQPTKIDLVVNLNTAKALGLRVPQSVLLRADLVIK